MQGEADKEGGPDPVDVHVGARLRGRRTVMGLSQSDLAREVGLTFQQIQKYERGINRISASRLFQFAGILGVDIEYFFAGLDAAEGEALRPGIDVNPAAMREVLALVRAYYAIGDEKLRRELFELVKAMAGGDGESGASAG